MIKNRREISIFEDSQNLVIEKRKEEKQESFHLIKKKSRSSLLCKKELNFQVVIIDEYHTVCVYIFLLLTS